jgi:hypothetical protein
VELADPNCDSRKALFDGVPFGFVGVDHEEGRNQAVLCDDLDIGWKSRAVQGTWLALA